jgi:hypothetical protein
MFAECAGPVLVIFCTRSGWPNSLERAVTELARQRPSVTVKRLAARHTDPVWQESARTSDWILDFLAASDRDVDDVDGGPGQVSWLL